MRYIRRFLALLTAACLLVSSASAVGFEMVSADETDAQKLLRSYDKKEGYLYLELGRYPYTADGEIQPVLWEVLYVENDVALLFTHYCIDFAQFNEERKDEPTWKDYTIYHTLNEVMVPEMFTDEELSAILLDEELGWLYYPTTQDMWNNDYGYRAGHWPYAERKCEPTPYAKANPHAWVSSETYCTWYFTRNVMRTGTHGLVGYDGHTSVAANNRWGGVRPMCRVDMTKLDNATGSGTVDDPYVFTVVSGK